MNFAGFGMTMGLQFGVNSFPIDGDFKTAPIRGNQGNLLNIEIHVVSAS